MNTSSSSVNALRLHVFFGRRLLSTPSTTEALATATVMLLFVDFFVVVIVICCLRPLWTSTVRLIVVYCVFIFDHLNFFVRCILCFLLSNSGAPADYLRQVYQLVFSPYDCLLHPSVLPPFFPIHCIIDLYEQRRFEWISPYDLNSSCSSTSLLPCFACRTSLVSDPPSFFPSVHQIWHANQ